MNSAMIIIDVWGGPECLVNRIIHYIENCDDVSVFILASYNADENKSDHLWYFNKRRFIPANIRQKDIPFNGGNKKTDKKLLEYRNESKLLIAMRSIDELSYFLSKHPEIDSIIYAGGWFDLCIKDRDLGYENVSKSLKDKNISLYVDSCIVNDSKNGVPPIDMTRYPEWVQVKNNLYRYTKHASIAQLVRAPS